jgi:hypothetical protein
MTEYLGYKDFLRWNYTVWPDNPRNDIKFISPYGMQGKLILYIHQIMENQF